MSDERKYYCLCGDNCKFETMTKEQILAAIAQAVESGTVGDVDAGFITKVKETNSGSYVTFWVGTQAQYNALESIEMNCIYIITDDTGAVDFDNTVAELRQMCESIDTKVTDTAAELKEMCEGTDTKVNKMAKVDISEKVTFEYDAEQTTATATNCIVYPASCIYHPDMGVVFFSLNVSVIGVCAAGQRIVLKQTGSYLPAVDCAAVCSKPNYAAQYKTAGTLEITAGVEDSAVGFIRVSGWYFCDGE